MTASLSPLLAFGAPKVSFVSLPDAKQHGVGVPLDPMAVGFMCVVKRGCVCVAGVLPDGLARLLPQHQHTAALLSWASPGAVDAVPAKPQGAAIPCLEDMLNGHSPSLAFVWVSWQLSHLLTLNCELGV